MENGSRLKTINWLHFTGCILKSVYIPCSMQFLGKGWLSSSAVDMFVFEANSCWTRIDELCFSRCSLESICIPQSVQVLEKSCFDSARIESLTFGVSWRWSISMNPVLQIAYWIQFAFRVPCEFSAHQNFHVQKFMRWHLNSARGWSKWMNSVSATTICIPRPVELSDNSCFANAKIESVTFESESGLWQINKLSFSECTLASVCVPCSIQVLGKWSFIGVAIDSNDIRSSS
jgi:hypothetical protein